MLDFISNLYKKNAPPLVPEAGVTQVIDDLPADNPAMALEELTHWLVDLSNEAGVDLQARLQRLARIDKAAQKYERTLRRQYTDALRMHKAAEARIWNANADFLEATVSAHLRCAAQLSQYKGGQYDRELAIIIMRSLRRLDLHAHWLYLRYCPIPAALWGQLYFLINLAEDRALMHLPVTLNSTAKVQTTVAQELLKFLMMSVVAPEHLTKSQIDLARLLTHNLAGTFCWEKLPRGSAIFHLDFSKPGVPVPVSKKHEPHFQSRYFGSAEAVRALIVGLMQLERGETPATLGTIDFASFKHEDLLAVMTHLSQRWCKLDARHELQAFDQRHTERTQVFYRISVAHRFDFLHQQLMQALAANSASVSEMDEDEPESWVVENISEMGYGVTISYLKEDWVKSHTVIGIQSDGAPWQIGVIRRIASESGGDSQAGIQILSNQARAVTLHPAHDASQAKPTPGIFMHREPPYQNQESLLFVAGSYQLHHTYALVAGKEKRTVRLLDRINTFEGVDQVIFADMKSKP